MNRNARIGIIVGVIVIVAFFVVFMMRGIDKAPEPLDETAPVATEDGASLGEELFSEVADPINEGFQSPNPAENANPIEDLYENPFQ